MAEKNLWDEYVMIALRRNDDLRTAIGLADIVLAERDKRFHDLPVLSVDLTKLTPEEIAAFKKAYTEQTVIKRTDAEGNTFITMPPQPRKEPRGFGEKP